jgi:hypothetical protein
MTMSKRIVNGIRAGLACLFLVSSVCAQEEPVPAREERRNPALLSFDELLTLSSTAKPEGPLGTRLKTLLTTPFVDNDASAAGIQPHRPSVERLGPVLRVGLWNIERGLNFELIRSALSDTNEFERLRGNPRPMSDPRTMRLKSQLADLQDVDVLVLNEVDFGMKRTEYRDVARELASALHMNYDSGNAARIFDQPDFSLRRGTNFTEIHAKGTEHLSAVRNNRTRPTSEQSHT